MNNNESAERSGGWRVTYNAKFTLSFCLLALVMLLFNMVTRGAANNLFSLSPSLNVSGAYRLISYIFCHANVQHLVSNFLFLLLLGPILEEKYGAKLMAVMTVATAIATGLANAAFFNDSIIGASGIVFMFIVLSSIVNVKQKEIPLTFIFIVIIYIGGELFNGFNEDNISQFGHIFGGLCGGVLGFVFSRKKI
ncbi:rhomboid family intramembrane serine protease [Vicingaceae bacterium]|nr:rhomboid family intramembrane serine protease [Vicingaceae bacterium]